MLKVPYFLALDLDSGEEALQMAERVAPFVGGFKVGPRLILRYGPELLKQLKRLGPVFLDQKYFDIPSTMESAVEASFAAGADYVTVHAQAGREALERLARLEERQFGQVTGRILAVTILTSFSQGTLVENLRSEPIADHVEKLARLTFSCGLRGLVCSSEEVEKVRKLSSSSYLVVPGVRLPGDHVQDQKRVATPYEILSRGASTLVVGRPILEAADPVMKAQEFERECRRPLHKSGN